MNTNQNTPFNTMGEGGSFNNFTLPANKSTQIPNRQIPSLNYPNPDLQNPSPLPVPQSPMPMPISSEQTRCYIVQVKQAGNLQDPLGTTVLRIPVNGTHWKPLAATITIGRPVPAYVPTPDLSRITMNVFKRLLHDLVLGDRFEMGAQLRGLVTDPVIGDIFVVWIGGGGAGSGTQLVSQLVTDDDLLFAIDVMSARDVGDHFSTCWKGVPVQVDGTKTEIPDLSKGVEEEGTPEGNLYVTPGRRPKGSGRSSPQKMSGEIQGRKNGYGNYGGSPGSKSKVRSWSGGSHKFQRSVDRVLDLLNR